MLHSLAARALLMMGCGVSAADAVGWVLRRFHQNMVAYWRELLLRELDAALA